MTNIKVYSVDYNTLGQRHHRRTNMTTSLKPAGYMIQDNQGTAIFGIGSTVDEAWTEVVDGLGTFYDSSGKEIPADQAYRTQFKTYGATAALLEEVERRGGRISWEVVGGVGCTIGEEP